MIYASQFLTLDGVATDPDVWHAEYASEHSYTILRDELTRADAHLLGRTTFDEFNQFWPYQDSDVPIADETNTLPKIVVSTTPNTTEWGSGADRDDIAFGSTTVVASLDQIPTDRTLILSGSITLTQALLAAGMIDELHLYIDPLVRGEGRRLFSDGTLARLERTRHEDLPHGMTYLEYRVQR